MITCWDTLDLAPTEDRRAIKRAYATLLKRNKPDENPEGFTRIHDAYQEALNAVKYGYVAHYLTDTEPEPEHDRPEEVPRESARTSPSTEESETLVHAQTTGSSEAADPWSDLGPADAGDAGRESSDAPGVSDDRVESPTSVDSSMAWPDAEADPEVEAAPDPIAQLLEAVRSIEGEQLQALNNTLDGFRRLIENPHTRGNPDNWRRLVNGADMLDEAFRYRLGAELIQLIAEANQHKSAAGDYNQVVVFDSVITALEDRFFWRATPDIWHELCDHEDYYYVLDQIGDNWAFRQAKPVGGKLVKKYRPRPKPQESRETTDWGETLFRWTIWAAFTIGIVTNFLRNY